MDLMKDYENADTLSIDTLALEEVLDEERTKEISELSTLSKKVSYLHTSIIYYRNAKSKMGATCYEAWKTLVKKIGGSPNTWKDLGSVLGVTQEDLDYITNSSKEDPADLVLKVFMQNETATLDKVIDALVKLKRYDVLRAIKEKISNLAQFFDNEDSGYVSLSRTPRKRELVSFKNFKNDLPPALNKNFIKDKDRKPNQPSLSPSKKNEKSKIDNDCPILFLTYTEDGMDTALNIQKYVNNWDSPRVVVLTLNGRRDDIHQNPEKLIREYFEKADFIVPIITTGYLNRIKSHSPQVPSTNDNLDFKYVNFIYNLIINHYIHATGCLNEKVRSVLPLNADVDLLRQITMYPDLLPWTYELDFDKTFKEFLKKD